MNHHNLLYMVVENKRVERVGRLRELRGYAGKSRYSFIRLELVTGEVFEGDDNHLFPARSNFEQRFKWQKHLWRDAVELGTLKAAFNPRTSSLPPMLYAYRINGTKGIPNPFKRIEDMIATIETAAELNWFCPNHDPISSWFFHDWVAANELFTDDEKLAIKTQIYFED